MNEYNSLLEIRYGLCTDDQMSCYHRVYGTDVIEDLRKLITGHNLVVALDQASNKTGVCFMDFETRKVLAVLDLINVGFPSKFMYFNAIFEFAYNHIAEEHIMQFIYEIPVEHSKNSRTLAILEALRMFIKDFKMRIPSLSKVNMTEIGVTTWRGHFLADNKYKGRRKERDYAKEATREEAANRVPELTNYFYRTQTPPDSCDAVGIAYGALEEIYSAKDWKTRKPNKTMPRLGIKFKYIVEPVTLDGISVFLQERFPIYFENRMFEILEYNPDLTVEDSCHRYCGVSKKLGIIPIFSSKIAQELKWETGKELKSNEFYTAFCWRST